MLIGHIVSQMLNTVCKAKKMNVSIHINPALKHLLGCDSAFVHCNAVFPL